MALNFPSSPTNGQQYANWVYDSAKGAWEAKPLEAMAATPSPTAPLTPQSGDMWYNTNDGGVYVYYNDGNTSQWVQMKSDATLSSTLGERTTTLENKLGLSRIIPPTVAVSGGSATANSLGLITFTAATNIILDNCFTTLYDQYLLVATIAGNSTGMDINFRFRSTSADYSTGYYGAGVGVFFSTAPQANNQITNGGNAVITSQAASTAANQTSSTISLSSTYSSVATQAANVSYGGAQLFSYSTNAGARPFGFRIYPSTGNITGTFKLYGYNQ